MFHRSDPDLSFSHTSKGMIPMATIEGSMAIATKTASYHQNRWFCSNTLMRATYKAQQAKTKQDVPCLTGISEGSMGFNHNLTNISAYGNYG